MRAVTVHQPWAWAIVAGYKRIENRTWAVSPGRIAIHAAVTRRSWGVGTEMLWRCQIDVPAESHLKWGAVIGTVEVVEIVYPISVTDEWDVHFADGPLCWVLRNPRKLSRPIFTRGEQRLFSVEL